MEHEKKKIRLALIGTNGIPANYGGAETFYEFLTKELSSKYDITVYCSKRQPKDKVGDTYLGAKLKYWPLSANGWQAFIYDGFSVIHAAMHSDVLLIFGAVGSGILVWFMRLFGFKKPIILNHGGLDEWKRESYPWIVRKLGFFTRWLTRNKVIHVADNNLLADSLRNSFGITKVNVIRYGGDQAFHVTPDKELIEKYPFLEEDYYVAVARAQVDNNLHVLLEAFAQMPDKKLVLVSNFKVSEYGQKLYKQYKDIYPNMILIPGIYDKKELNAVRSNAKAYIHSHSRCGTPPSLCEAMNHGLPIISFDAEVNHEVTNEQAFFFATSEDLVSIVSSKSDKDYKDIAEESLKWAKQNLSWNRIGELYSRIIEGGDYQSLNELLFIGDVMLGRMVGAKYTQQSYPIVSEELVKEAKNCDYVIANLESPVVTTQDEDADHLQFQGNPDALDELKWIDAFSLSNNHINDCGERGMDETVSILNDKGFLYNGLFQTEYKPLLIEKKGEKIAVVTVTDMMNVPFEETNKWKTFRVGEEKVHEVIKEWHDKGWFVILYAHIGILFSRYPNPVTVEYLHGCVDSGADAVVTVHSHCLGCMEMYKRVPIFHSLGDFVMDGNSFRRRRSGILKLVIEKGQVAEWSLIPAEINSEYVTDKPREKSARKMLKEFNRVSGKLALHIDSYTKFFKWQYRKEMVLHTSSTLHYLMKSRGVLGMFKMLIQRFEEVGRMFKWVVKDRSKDRRDDDAIKADRKKFKRDELF